MAKEMHPALQPQALGLRFQCRALAALPGQHHMPFRRQMGQRRDQHILALDQLKPANTADQARLQRQFETQPRIAVRARLKAVEIDAIRHDGLPRNPIAWATCVAVACETAIRRGATSHSSQRASWRRRGCA